MTGWKPAGVFRRMTRHHIIIYARRQQHPTRPRHPNRVDRHLPSPTDEMSNWASAQPSIHSHVDRVQVHVVQMARIVSLVPNSMLLKTSLPDATFTLRHSYQ